MVTYKLQHVDRLALIRCDDGEKPGSTLIGEFPQAEFVYDLARRLAAEEGGVFEHDAPTGSRP